MEELNKIKTLEKRVRLLIRGYVILAISVIAALLVAHHTQTNLSGISKESTHQRVITVSQRCNLTMLITNVLAKDDPNRLEAFEKSYEECKEQLKKVEEIANKAK